MGLPADQKLDDTSKVLQNLVSVGRAQRLPQVDRTHPLVRWRALAGMEMPKTGPRSYGVWLREEDRRLGRL